MYRTLAIIFFITIMVPLIASAPLTIPRGSRISNKREIEVENVSAAYQDDIDSADASEILGD